MSDDMTVTMDTIEKKKTVLTMETAGQGTLMITQTQIAHVHIGL